jgi:hypothetical protein
MMRRNDLAAAAVPIAVAIAVAVGGCSSESDTSVDEPAANAAPTVGGPDTPVRPSTSCDTPDAVFAATTDGTIESGGVDRQYKIFAPAV